MKGAVSPRLHVFLATSDIHMMERILVSIQKENNTLPDLYIQLYPEEYYSLFEYLQESVPSYEKAIFSCHCHDDLGMAVANSLAAVEGGALQVEGTHGAAAGHPLSQRRL